MVFSRLITLLNAALESADSRGSEPTQQKDCAFAFCLNYAYLNVFINRIHKEQNKRSKNISGILFVASNLEALGDFEALSVAIAVVTAVEAVVVL